MLVLLLAPTLVWPELFEQLGSALDSTARMARNGLTASIWVAGAWLLIRMVDVVFWDGIVAPRLGGKVPGLLNFEVRKADVEPLFAARRELATVITNKVAERRLRSQARLAAANAPPPSEEETRSLADQILGKMRGLFGI